MQITISISMDYTVIALVAFQFALIESDQDLTPVTRHILKHCTILYDT